MGVNGGGGGTRVGEKETRGVAELGLGKDGWMILVARILNTGGWVKKIFGTYIGLRSKLSL